MYLLTSASLTHDMKKTLWHWDNTVTPQVSSKPATDGYEKGWPRVASTDQIPVAQLVQPEVVDGCGGRGKVVRFQAFVARFHSIGQATQDPTIQLCFLAWQLQNVKT